jgi:hypothetical protein
LHLESAVIRRTQPGAVVVIQKCDSEESGVIAEE